MRLIRSDSEDQHLKSTTCPQLSPHGSARPRYRKGLHWRIVARSVWHVHGTGAVRIRKRETFLHGGSCYNLSLVLATRCEPMNHTWNQRKTHRALYSCTPCYEKPRNVLS